MKLEKALFLPAILFLLSSCDMNTSASLGGQDFIDNAAGKSLAMDQAAEKLINQIDFSKYPNRRVNIIYDSRGFDFTKAAIESLADERLRNLNILPGTASVQKLNGLTVTNYQYDYKLTFTIRSAGTYNNRFLFFDEISALIKITLAEEDVNNKNITLKTIIARSSFYRNILFNSAVCLFIILILGAAFFFIKKFR